MSVRTEKYKPSMEVIQGLMEYMNKVSNDVKKKTEAPDGACSVAAIKVVRGLLDAAESEIQGLVHDEPTGRA